MQAPSSPVELTVATTRHFELLYEVMRDYARQIYVDETSEVEPAIFVLAKHEAVPGEKDIPDFDIKIMSVGAFQADSLGTHGKDLIASILMTAAEVESTYVAGYLTEAWMVVASENNVIDDSVSPSKSPHRKECLMFNLLSSDCQAMQAALLVRANGGTTFEDVPLNFLTAGAHEQQGRFVRPPKKMN